MRPGSAPGAARLTIGSHMTLRGERLRSLARIGLGAVFIFILVGLGEAAGNPYAPLALIQPAKKTVAKEFALPGPKGSIVKLRDFRGKVVLLNFWATWCPPCLEEMPAIEQLYQRYRERGLVVLALSEDTEGEKVVTPFLQEHKLTFPVAYDAKMKVAELYQLRALPTTYLINREGQITATALGPRAWDSPDAHALIESLLK